MVLKRGEGERCRERERDAGYFNPIQTLTIYNKMLLLGSFWSRLAFCEPNWYKLIRAEAVLRENLIEQFLGRFSSGVRQALGVFIQWTCSLSACKTICIEIIIHARIRILPRANGSMNDTLNKLCALMPVRFGGASLRTGLLLVPHAPYLWE